MIAHIFLLLSILLAGVIAWQYWRLSALKHQLLQKTGEVSTARIEAGELREKLEKIKQESVKAKPKLKPTPLMWMGGAAEPTEPLPVGPSGPAGNPVNSRLDNVAVTTHTPEKERKYKDLYYRLDEHIQKFSKLANTCLHELADRLKQEKVSCDIRNPLADLSVNLRRLNPMVNTSELDLTIFGEKKEVVVESPEADPNAQGLRNVIIKQREIIHDLRKKMAELGNATDSSQFESQLQELERVIRDSENCIKTLENELVSSRAQLEVKETQVSRTQFLQQRIIDLESHEKQLVCEVSELKNQYLQSVFSDTKAHEMNGKIRDLKQQVREREEKLKRFQNETVTLEGEYQKLFENYQAMIKQYGVKEEDLSMSSIPTEVLLEVEGLKAILQSKEFELDRAKSECKLLEDSYLSIAASTEELDKAKNELEHLRIENITLGQQLEQAMTAKASTDDMVKELHLLETKYKQLKHESDLGRDELNRLRIKEDELKRLRVEYGMMEEQFLNLAMNSLK